MDIKSNKETKVVYKSVVPNGAITFIISTIMITVAGLAIWAFVIGNFDTTSWTPGSKVALVITILIASGVSTGLYLEAAEEKLKKLRNNDWN